MFDDDNNYNYYYHYVTMFFCSYTINKKKMLFIRWIVKEMIPYKNVNYMQSYLHYQNEIANNPESEANRLFKRSIWLQMYQLIRYFFLFLLPLNQVQRTLVYDIFFLLGLHSSINSIGMFLTALGMFLSYKLYIEIPENIIRLMNMILFNSNGNGSRYFLQQQHKKQDVCHFIRKRLLESIIQNQLFIVLLFLFALFTIDICVKEILSFIASLQMNYNGDDNLFEFLIRYLKISGFILCSSFNCLTFDLAQYLLAHCYIMCTYIFTFITWTLFLKLDQINLILNRNKTINENHPRYYSRIVNRFIWLHGHTFIHVNHFCNYLSDLFSSYMIANFPMNMLFIVTTFIIENNANKFYSWKFFAFGVIVQQFIGFFIIHLICSLYTIKIHKCSPKLIYCRIHFPLQPLSLRLRTSLYIEKIHNKNQYGIVLARTKVISMIFFIKVCFN